MFDPSPDDEEEKRRRRTVGAVAAAIAFPVAVFAIYALS